MAPIRQGVFSLPFALRYRLAAVKGLKSYGAEIAMEPADTPGVAFAFIRNNAGDCFELIQYKNSSSQH
jgi:hypothetical protein